MNKLTEAQDLSEITEKSQPLGVYIISSYNFTQSQGYRLMTSLNKITGIFLELLLATSQSSQTVFGFTLDTLFSKKVRHVL